MQTPIFILFATLGSMSSAAAWAGEATGACALLTQAEIDAATGSKSGAGNAMAQDIPDGAGQHLTMYACLWPVSGVQGQMALSMGPLPPGQSARSLTVNNIGMDALRAQHYVEETKDFGDATCSSMTPPADKKDGLGMSACSVVAQGKIVSVTYMSPGKALSVGQTKALLDKAVARVH